MTRFMEYIKERLNKFRKGCILNCFLSTVKHAAGTNDLSMYGIGLKRVLFEIALKIMILI